MVAGTLLLLPSSAQAHVTPAPPFVEADRSTTVSFETPNERAGHVTTSLELTAPSGIELSERPPPSGWQLELSSDRVRWWGGRIAGTDTVSFPVTATARTSAGPVTFFAEQGYEDGEVVRWATTLTVLPATADAPPQHFRRALVGGAIGLVVIAGSLVALRRLRRGPLQDR